MRPWCAVWGLLAACSGGTDPLSLPTGIDAETLIVHVDFPGAAPVAEASARPFRPSIDIDETKDSVLRLLYFAQTPDELGVAVGDLTVTDESDALGLELVADVAYEARVKDSQTAPFEMAPTNPIHVAQRQPGQLTFSVRQWGMPELLGGIEACVDGAPQGACERSNAVGAITVGGLEPGAEHVVRLRSSTIIDTAFMVQTTSDRAELGSAIFAMPPGTPTDLATTFMTTIDPALGLIDVIAHTGTLNFDPQTVDVALSPMGGESFRTTTGNLVFNVQPGDYAMRISADGKDYCGPSGFGENWIGREADNVRLRVFAGTVTHVQNIVCQ